MLDFELVSTEQIFSGFVFDVERRHLTANGSPFSREVVHHPGAVSIVAIDDERRVILLEQYRATILRRHLETPAGTCDIHGEEPEQTARRELIEETGMDAGSWIRLGSFLNTPGYCDQQTVTFLATDLIDVGSAPSGPEELDATVHRIELGEAVRMIEQGEITDVTSVFGILLAARRYGI